MFNSLSVCLRNTSWWQVSVTTTHGQESIQSHREIADKDNLSLSVWNSHKNENSVIYRSKPAWLTFFLYGLHFSCFYGAVLWGKKSLLKQQLTNIFLLQQKKESHARHEDEKMTNSIFRWSIPLTGLSVNHLILQSCSFQLKDSLFSFWRH